MKYIFDCKSVAFQKKLDRVKETLEIIGKVLLAVFLLAILINFLGDVVLMSRDCKIFLFFSFSMVCIPCVIFYHAAHSKSDNCFSVFIFSLSIPCLSLIFGVVKLIFFPEISFLFGWPMIGVVCFLIAVVVVLLLKISSSTRNYEY